MTLAVPTPPLRLKTPPARQGVIWVRQGFRVFSARPLAFTALLAAFLFGAMLLLALPIVGSMLVLMAVPLLTLVFQLATRAALDGRVPTPALFVAALRGDARRTRLLVQLGVGYAIATLFIVTFSDWVDGGAMRALEDALGSGRPDEVQAVLEQPDLQLGMLLRLSLAALLSLPSGTRRHSSTGAARAPRRRSFRACSRAGARATRSSSMASAGRCSAPCSRCSRRWCSACSAAGR